MSTIDKLKNFANAKGQKGTRAARLILHGTRRASKSSAGTAPPSLSAIGVGAHSVWETSRSRPGGAPIPKRPRTA